MADKSEVFKGEVTAIARGYAGGTIREVGETFHYEGPLGSWMEPIEKAKTAPPAPAPKATT
jgi:hypothetical protein